MDGLRYVLKVVSCLGTRLEYSGGVAAVLIHLSNYAERSMVEDLLCLGHFVPGFCLSNNQLHNYITDIYV